MTLRDKAKSLIKRTPGFWPSYLLLKAIRHSQNPFLRSAAPGHFYSPIPDIKYVRKYREKLFARDSTSVAGVELATEKQIALVKDLASYYDEMPFSDENTEGHRYCFDNPFFGHGSSIALYSLMRHFNPRRIVEVGSGFSSAAMLDVNDLFFNGNILFTFIEPYPKRLYSLLGDKDKNRYRVYVDRAQDIPAELFAELDCNDFLFIDSSHVAKIGSDVVFLLTEVLPRLRKGVVIHFHDIYWPFEYPEEWVLGGKAWNEAYLVKAFLQFNRSFEILLFNSYLALHHEGLMRESLPLFLPDSGSSLWISKTS